MGEHPVRDDIDLMSGHWYAGQPYEQWAWMREHAPGYWDAKNEVWGITRYHDVLAIEKDAPAGEFSAPVSLGLSASARTGAKGCGWLLSRVMASLK